MPLEYIHSSLEKLFSWCITSMQCRIYGLPLLSCCPSCTWVASFIASFKVSIFSLSARYKKWENIVRLITTIKKMRANHTVSLALNFWIVSDGLLTISQASFTFLYPKQKVEPVLSFVI